MFVLIPKLYDCQRTHRDKRERERKIAETVLLRFEISRVTNSYYPQPHN